MSGADVFSVATAVTTVITSTARTAQIAKALYNEDPIPEDELRIRASAIEDAAKTMRARCQSFNPTTKDERNLVALATKCEKTAASLVRMVTATKPVSAKNKLLQSVEGAFKLNSFMGKSKLNKIESELVAYQGTLQTQILVHLCTRSDAASLQQSEAFRQLDDDVKHFISQYTAGYTMLSDLVKLEHEETRRSAVGQIQEAEVAIKEHVTTNVTQFSSQISSQSQRDKLLNSFKYSRMNARRNFIKEAHEGTFQWVLRSKPSGNQYIREESHRESDWETKDSATSVPSDSEDNGHHDDGRNSKSEPRDLGPATEPHELPEFVHWLRSTQDIFWISGKPGSGKSTLMKYIIEDPETKTALKHWRSHTIILSHYFWKPGSMLERDCKGLWCTLAYQRALTDEGTLDYILDRFPSSRIKNEPSDWSLKELEVICLELIAFKSTPLCIFLDGVDEIDNYDGVLGLKKVMGLISSRLPGEVKFCLSGRPERPLQTWLQDMPKLELHTLTEVDIARLIYDRLDQYMTRLGDDTESLQLLKRIIRILTEKASGVFIWLVLALQSVVNGLEAEDSWDEVIDRIEQLPSEMEDLYGDMWGRLNEGVMIYRQRAAQYFNVAIAASRCYHSLTILEMQIATSNESPIIHKDLDPSYLNTHAIKQLIKQTRRDIEKRCAGLLVPMQHTVEFVHRTAYDYLTTNPHGQSILSHDPSSGIQIGENLLKAMWADARVQYRVMGRMPRPMHHLMILSKKISHKLPGAFHGLDRLAISLEVKLEQIMVPILPTATLKASWIIAWMLAHPVLFKPIQEQWETIRCIFSQESDIDMPIVTFSLSYYLSQICHGLIGYPNMLPTLEIIFHTVQQLLRLGADQTLKGCEYNLRSPSWPRFLDGQSSLELWILICINRSTVRPNWVDLLNDMITSPNNLTDNIAIVGAIDDTYWRFAVGEIRKADHLTKQHIRLGFRVSLVHMLYPILYMQNHLLGLPSLQDCASYTQHLSPNLLGYCLFSPDSLMTVMSRAIDHTLPLQLVWIAVLQSSGVPPFIGINIIIFGFGKGKS